MTPVPEDGSPYEDGTKMAKMASDGNTPPSPPSLPPSLRPPARQLPEPDWQGVADAIAASRLSVDDDD